MDVLEVNGMQPWHAWAWDELRRGVLEIRGAKHNPDILAYFEHCTKRPNFLRADETPWCSAFMCAAFELQGIESTRDPAARSWLKWGIKLDGPIPGAVVVFSRPPRPWSGHVALVQSADAQGLDALGGNQGNRVSVSRRTYDRVLGYRWPAGVQIPTMSRSRANDSECRPGWVR